MLATAIRTGLPEGFTLLRVEANRLHAVAYDSVGTRIDVAVFPDADVEGALSSGVWTDTPAGKASAVESTAQLITGPGDHLVASASFGDGQSRTAGVDLAVPLLPGLLDVVGAALTGPGREEMVGLPEEWVGAAGIGDEVSAAVREAIGLSADRSGSGSQGGGRGWLTQYELVDEARHSASVTVAATYTSVRLPDGEVVVDAERSVVHRWINGWQLVVSGSGAAAVPLVPAATDAAAGVFDAWEPAPRPTTCATYTVVTGDSLAGIAARFGSNVDELIAANGGASAITPGDVLQLPCAAARPQERSTDVSELAGFLGSHPTVANSEFSPGMAIIVASGTDVWVLTGGNGIVDPDRPGVTAGKVHIDSYDRASGAPSGSAEVLLQGCPGPVEPIDDLAAPLDAIPLRCVADGTMGTIDVFNGRSPEFTLDGPAG